MDDIDLDAEVVHNLAGERVTNARAEEMARLAEHRARSRRTLNRG